MVKEIPGDTQGRDRDSTFGKPYRASEGGEMARAKAGTLKGDQRRLCPGDQSDPKNCLPMCTGRFT